MLCLYVCEYELDTGPGKEKNLKFAVYCVPFENVFYNCGKIAVRNHTDEFLKFFSPSLVENKTILVLELNSQHLVQGWLEEETATYLGSWT